MSIRRIHQKIKTRNIPIHHAAEVGVYIPETSNVIDFINEGIRTTLVEADPAINEKIRSFFKGKNIELHPYAVWDREGTIKLSKANASTFVTELKSSPAIENDKYVVKEEDTFEVACVPFSKIDDGTIDFLSIDIEGSEWYVIKHLKSRPKVLSIETHGKYYTNPFIKEIGDWTTKNNYVTWYKDGSDTVFVRADVFAPSVADKLTTMIEELKIQWKKLKGSLKGAYKPKK
jgi:FkbM family methyltransferase